MTLLRRKRVIAAKIETTPGTAESLSASDAAFNAYETSVNPTIDFEERQGQSAFSPLPGTLGAYGGTVTFQTDIHGGGSTPFWASVLLPACGYKETTGVFAPVTEAPGSNVKTLTIGVYEDGLFKVLRGCAGNVVFTLPSGRRAFAEWTFTGIWGDPTDVSILAPTYPTTAPLKFANSTWTLGSWSPCVEQITIDLGNEVVLRECGTDSSGYKNALVTNRRTTGTMNPEATLVATNDAYGDWIDRTEKALSIVLGSSGNRVTFAAPKLQLTNAQEGDRNNIQTDDLEFQLNRSAAAGNDELSIDLT